MRTFYLAVILSVALTACGDDSANNSSNATTSNGVANNNSADAGNNSSNATTNNGVVNNNFADAGNNSAADSGNNSTANDAGEEPDSGTEPDGGDTEDTGSSPSTCDPYAADPGCAVGDMCVPGARDAVSGAISGTCEPAGTAALDDACDGTTAATTCAEGLFCRDTCTPHCDPDATGADPGACGANQGCVPVINNLGAFEDWGACNTTCDYTHGDPMNPATPCSGDASCLAGELLGVDFDVCGETPPLLDVGASCSDAGINQFELCGLNSICFDLDSTGEVTCRDLCFVSAGAFGSSPHPDCRNSTDTCEDTFSGADFGMCN